MSRCGGRALHSLVRRRWMSLPPLLHYPTSSAPFPHPFTRSLSFHSSHRHPRTSRTSPLPLSHIPTRHVSTSPRTSSPPLLPPPLSLTLQSLQSFPEVHSALSALSSSDSASAVPSLRRAYEIFSRISDPLPLLLILRLLGTAYHLQGMGQEEAGVRLEAMKRVEGMKGADEGSVVMRAQAAFSYRVLPQHWRSSQGNVLAGRLLHGEVEAGDQRLKANVEMFNAATAEPSPATLKAYEDALAVLASSSPSSTTERSPLTAYVDRLLNAGDVHLLMGDYHTKVGGAKEVAQVQYEKAVTFYNSLPSPALPLVQGGFQLPLAYALAALSRTSAAVTAAEESLGETHPFMATVLRWAALQQQREGEAIAAEGLFRASIGRLEKEGSRVRERKEELLSSMWQYAHLLNQLTWNERSRRTEGDHWRRKCEEMAAKDPALRLHLTRLQSGAHAEVQPWLVERFSV